MSTALGIDDWINNTPAANPLKLSIFINVIAITGPMQTRIKPSIIEFFHDSIFSFVKATPKDINTRKIVEYVSKKVVFSMNTGTFKLKYKKNIEINIP